MAAKRLSQELEMARITDTAESLPFSPKHGNDCFRQKFHDVPRYLFRIFTPISGSATDAAWAQSLDSRQGGPSSRVDLFDRGDNRLVADMLNKHLRWQDAGDGDSNVVSWTSSLLYALVHVYQLHASMRDGSALEDIKLCIVDTTECPDRSFVRDIDLIRSFSLFDIGLRDLKNLRLGKSQSKSSGCYYFGEYLSQGALRIEGRCQIVSAMDIINGGLYKMLPELEEFEDWNRDEKPPCARMVVRLRKSLGSRMSLAGREVDGEIHAALKIAQLFEPRWRLPMAASLIALIPNVCSDAEILRAFRGELFTEVQKFSDIMRSVYKDFCLSKSKEYVDRAEGLVRSALLWGGSTASPSASDRDMTVLDPIHDDIVDRLDDIIRWSSSLRQEMLKSRMVLVDSESSDKQSFDDSLEFEVGDTTLSSSPGTEMEHSEIIDCEAFPFKSLGNREKSVIGGLYIDPI
ncbi:unnamed protein product [Clonostachys rosea f. rosea IK726]|uniref:Uncharacterized protein n=1 Tax=Clonostachys rosea f. rosea IK726 TaxID=1349383 RepID=A0ACA9U2P9_BIOOC|nr:unnamed protein product [Clonostachys rosea f. rosea IK726]